MKISIYTILVFSLFLVFSCKQSDPVIKEKELLWFDEFNGEELDESKWEIMLGDGSQYDLWKWGNNEEQYYTKKNISIENGKLRIKAVAEEIQGYNFSSARIRSLNKGDFKYGRFEASIRMDNTPGLWHAFWMLPTEPSEGWPLSGEIDVMEYVGNSPNQILNYVHFADVQETHQSIGYSTDITQDNNFHVYAVDWNENEIIWYRDSIETFRLERTNDAISSTWPFDAKFHMLLNTAIGGNLGGNFDQDLLQTPRYMEVEYVRVYK